MKPILIAGGQGVRLRPFTSNQSKARVRIAKSRQPLHSSSSVSLDRLHLSRLGVLVGLHRRLPTPSGLHFLALALDLPGEEVVEHRADDHDSRQDLYLGDRRRHCRAEDVRT